MRDYVPKSHHIKVEPWRRIVSVIRDYTNMCNALQDYYEQGNKGMSDKHLELLRRNVAAYDNVWNRADEDTRKIVVEHFRNGKTYRDIIVYYSEISMKRRVGWFVTELGKELGEI